jgi:hypothetical protein
MDSVFEDLKAGLQEAIDFEKGECSTKEESFILFEDGEIVSCEGEKPLDFSQKKL